MEDFPQEVVSCADQPVVSKIPGYLCEDLQLDGDAIVAETLPSDRRVSYTVHFEVGKVAVSLDFIWRVPESDPEKATDEMKEEAIKAARSMLNQDK